MLQRFAQPHTLVFLVQHTWSLNGTYFVLKSLFNTSNEWIDYSLYIFKKIIEIMKNVHISSCTAYQSNLLS